jgi:hypothetical protein
MLGDYYRAEPRVSCPVCAQPVAEWEGFVGAGAWLLYTEGTADPSTERLPESMRAAEPTLAKSRLPDGVHSIYAACPSQHRLIAHVTVEDGVWRGLEIVDAEGHDGMQLRGPWRLWWTIDRLVSIAKARPNGAEDVIPATVSALGINDECILATRRTAQRTATPSPDEWWFVDIGRGRAHGPIPDPDLRARLAELGLEEPQHLTLPEDLGEPRQ